MQSFEASTDTQRLHHHGGLNQGSFALRNSPQGPKGGADIIRVAYDSLASDVIQRAGNSEVSVSLGNFSVFDETSLQSAYKQIVRVKKGSQLQPSKEPGSPAASSFLYVKYENNPLDDRADNALTVRLRHMEIIYHRGYVEAVYRFFKPPESQLVSVEALLVSYIYRLPSCNLSG
jgi:vacuolar protein sorting-associated protein 13A/C